MQTPGNGFLLMEMVVTVGLGVAILGVMVGVWIETHYALVTATTNLQSLSEIENQLERVRTGTTPTPEITRQPNTLGHTRQLWTVTATLPSGKTLVVIIPTQDR